MQAAFGSRSPHGERGLKYFRFRFPPGYFCRSPHGERGLKFLASDWDNKNKSRSPHGERGLKLRLIPCTTVTRRSLPAWGAWIEISFRALKL